MHKPESWSKDADREKCKFRSPGGGWAVNAQLSEELLLLPGEEQPKLYILWLIDLDKKVLSKDDLI